MDITASPATEAANAGTRILLMTPAVATGGAEAYLVALTRHLVNSGLDVHIGLGSDQALDGLCHRLIETGGKIVRDTLAWCHVEGDVAYRLQLQFEAAWRIIEQVLPDKIFLNLNWLNAGTALCAAASAARIPAVTLFHLCPHVIPMSEAERRLFRWSHAMGQRWFTVSKDNRLFVARSTGVSEAGIGVIYNGPLVSAEIDSENPETRAACRASLREELGLHTDATVMVTVGRHDLQKGLVDIMPALPALLARHPDMHYLWIGDGPLRELSARLIRRFDPAGQRVTFWLSRSDVPRCLLGSDLFLFPSRFEGFSLALLEAMHAGCCPVASDVSSIREMLQHKSSGILIPQGNIQALQAAVSDLMDHPDERARLGAGARKDAKRFPPDAMLAHATEALMVEIEGAPAPLPCHEDAWETIVSIASARPAA